MKISVDDIELFTLTEMQKRVIQKEIPADIFENEMKHRLKWSLIDIYDRCYKELKEEWEPKFASVGITLAPTDPDAYAALVFAQPDYLDCKARDEAAAALQPKP